MKSAIAIAVLSVAAVARAQDTTLETSNVPPLDADYIGFDDGRLDDAQPIQQPGTPQPTETPQLPTTIPPPPTTQQQPVTQVAGPANGQWIYTQQYGWVFAPYERSYTYVNDDVSAASMYCYRPVVGWTWLASPWVITLGPRPYWGNWGPYRYSYYSQPWFRVRPRAGTVHYYGRPNYYYHANPHPRANYYYHAPAQHWRGGPHGGPRRR